jgi:hypothetical protein
MAIMSCASIAKAWVARMYEKFSSFLRMEIPGIKIHDTRMLRLKEVLLHGGSQLNGWRTSRSRTPCRVLLTFLPKPTPSINSVTTCTR